MLNDLSDNSADTDNEGYKNFRKESVKYDYYLPLADRKFRLYVYIENI
ncbi:MAG: hypothetical protein II944_08995 [Ruminobacter sp.]|nr:hypothetical protein [Ruminobacter sp.]